MLNKILIRILPFVANDMLTNNQWCQKCVISDFVISQKFKKVIANVHKKLNSLVIAQTSYFLVACFYQNYWNRLRNVKDIANQNSVIFGIQRDWRDPIFGVSVSLGSAETSVRRGGIANHLLIEYSLSNISAKNYQNWLRYVKVIVCNISFVFWDTV